MKSVLKVGSILIKEGTIVPASLQIESEPYVTGWNVVTQLDGYGLGRVIEKAGWAFFCHSSELRAGAFGTNQSRMISRAVARILKNPQLDQFNALEISKVSSSGSGRFPGVRHLTVYVHARHIQKDLFLFRASSTETSAPAKSTIPDERAELPAGKAPALSF